MSRKLLGLITVCLLGFGGILLIGAPKSAEATQLTGGCIRVGLVLGALWLALPQIQATLARLPGWALSWFVGKGKSGESPTNSDAPVKRQRRPRRRNSP